MRISITNMGFDEALFNLCALQIQYEGLRSVYEGLQNDNILSLHEGYPAVMRRIAKQGVESREKLLMFRLDFIEKFGNQKRMKQEGAEKGPEVPEL